MKKPKLKKFKKGVIISLVSIVAVVATLEIMHLGFFAHAEAGISVAGTILSYLNTILYYTFVYPFAAIVGILSIILIEVINSPVKYVSMPAIQRAWMVVRDVANIAFIISLLVVAFSTTLGIERYSYKKLLPRILIMAVLVNFSRTIAGVFTDFATVLMRSFSGAVGSGSILATFGVTGWTNPGTIVEGSGTELDQSASMSLMILLIIVLLAVSCVTLAVWIVILLFRVVMIWFLVVLSPLAFALYATPNGEQYSKKWWEAFGRYVVLGPLIAFFFWLSLYIATVSGAANPESGGDPYNINSTGSSQLAANGDAAKSVLTIFPVTDPDTLINFIIAIMMMMAGLKFSKDMAGEISGLTGKVQSMATKGVKSLAKNVGGVGYGVRKGYGAVNKLWDTTNKLKSAGWGALGATVKKVPLLKNARTLHAGIQKRRAAAIDQKRKFGAIDDSTIERMTDPDKENMINSGVKFGADGSINYAEDTLGDNAKKIAKKDASAILNHKDFNSLPETAKNKVLKNAFKGMSAEDIGKQNYKEGGNLKKDGLPDTEADNKGAAMKRGLVEYLKGSHEKRREKVLEQIPDTKLREEIEGQMPAKKESGSGSGGGGKKKKTKACAERPDDEVISSVGKAVDADKFLKVRPEDRTSDDDSFAFTVSDKVANTLFDSDGNRVMGENNAVTVIDPESAKMVADSLERVMSQEINDLDGIIAKGPGEANDKELAQFLGDEWKFNTDGKSREQLEGYAAKGKKRAESNRDGLHNSSGDDLVEKGFILANRKYKGNVQNLIKHEKWESVMDNAQIEDKAFGKTYEKMNPTQQREISDHSKSRSDFGDMNKADQMREYIADHAAGIVKKEMSGIAEAFKESITEMSKSSGLARAKIKDLENNNFKFNSGTSAVKNRKKI